MKFSEATMVGRYVVYGLRGTGSVPIEATLLLLGEPYELKEAGRSENPEAGIVTAEAIARVNPMEQLPALILPNGEVMTESAAILIHLADSHPASRLPPTTDDPRRPAFLRWIFAVRDGTPKGRSHRAYRTRNPGWWISAKDQSVPTVG